MFYNKTKYIFLVSSIFIIILFILYIFVFTKKYSSPSVSRASPSVSRASPSVSPANLQNKTISINGINRNYKLNKIDTNIDTVLLCFPGGGDTIETFISYSGLDQIDSSIIIFEGQKSINKYSWQNAFPWLYKDEVQNDVLFVDTVLKSIYNTNIPTIFLTGKSDGGGFSVLYSNISNYKNNIKAIGIFSSAHFGLSSFSNISPYDINNINIISPNIIIPKNIVLPSNNVSIFLIHGTGDQIMPYLGINFESSLALKQSSDNIASDKISLWSNIDTGIPNNNNTYTVNIPSYISNIIKTYNNNVYSNTAFSNSNTIYTWSSSTSNSNLVFNSINIINQNHNWSGHTGSNAGPDNNNIANSYLDATYLLIKFLKLNQGTYKPTISTIPSNLRTYDNNII